MKDLPDLVGRHLLGAMSMIASCSSQYVSNDLSRANFKNYWIVDSYKVVDWRPGYINVKLSAHGHKYRIVTMQYKAIVVHIVPKRSMRQEAQPVWYIRLWNKIRSVL